MIVLLWLEETCYQTNCFCSSRSHSSHFILNGALITSKVENVKAKACPFVQGGLEIIMNLKVQWNSNKQVKFLKVKINEVMYSTNEEYFSDSQNILNVNILMF